MKNTFLYLLPVFVLSAQGKKGENEECDLEMKNDKVKPLECCVGYGTNPNIFKKEVMEKCLEKIPPPEQMLDDKQGTNMSDTAPDIRNYRACVTECLFLGNGFLKDDKIDRVATTKALLTQNGNFSALLSKDVDKCADAIKNVAETGSTCKSGAVEFTRCLPREMFLNCPSALWNNSTECEEAKRQVIKCPLLYF